MSDTQEIRGADYLSELIKSVIASAPPEQSSENSPTSQSSENSPMASASADLFTSLLSNPELISKLPSILSTVRPIIEMMSKNKDQAISSVSATPQSEEKKTKPPNDRRAALLCAMKPYLGHDRQLAIDYIIKLSRLGDILKTL